jgi:hypothetical protein
VDDAFLVRRVERRRNLFRDFERLDDREAGAGTLEALRERFTFDELQDERADVGGLLDAIDGADVGMIDGREQPRFAREACEAFGVVGEGARHDLDRDVAPQPIIVGAVDLSHAAGAQPPRHAVGTETAIEQVVACGNACRGQLRIRIRRQRTPIASQQQRLDVPTQIVVAGARLGQEGGARVGISSQGLMEQARELLPPVWRHLACHGVGAGAFYNSLLQSRRGS